MKKTAFTIALLMVVLSAFSQKRALDHSVYDSWKNMGSFSMSDDGKILSYMVREQEGDTYFEILNTSTFKKFKVERAVRAHLTPDGRFLVGMIKPHYAKLKEARIKKVKFDQQPKDTLGIFDIAKGELRRIPNAKMHKLGRYGKEFVAYRTTPPTDTSNKKKSPPPKKKKDEGEDLIVYHLPTGNCDTLKAISDFNFTLGGDSLFVVRKSDPKDSTLQSGLFMYLPKTKELTTIYPLLPKQNARMPVVSEDNSDIVFYANLDTTKKSKESVSILHYREGYPQAKIILDDNTPGVEEGWKISLNRALIISKSGKRLLFGISPTMPEKDSSIVESEMAKLDIWHYQDPYLQPSQLLSQDRERKKSYLCTIDLDGKSPFVRLSTDQYHIVTIPNGSDADWGYSLSNWEYRIESQWSSNPRNDLYVVDVKSGKATLLLKDQFISLVHPSPNGKYLVWYNNLERDWYSYTRATGEIKNITSNIGVSFANEMHDTPQLASSYGTGGWQEGEGYIYLNDRYDIWKIDPSNQTAPVNLTNGDGRRDKVTYRIVRLERMLLPPGTPGVRKTPLVDGERIYFSLFNNITKENGYSYKETKRANSPMVKWVEEPATFVYLYRSKDGKVITYVKHNFENSPNLWITKDNFKSQTQLTDINPQQREYNWGSAQLVKWRAVNGEELNGILYKPENFDPTKKYPMIVYFYETYSHYLHYYRAPAPSASTINIPFFVSNEYLVFVPDIHYQVGQPGKSALDCIVPGVKKLIGENSWVDPHNIAIQGQSWGGYQVAYMVTQPQVFKWKAAGAGAPVANMTSAYGGIRWGSGMARQFQYEHTQSRIGKDLWSGLYLYLENSPLFFADRVETPLLIMHNDQDEAVPWYQGIEYFNALRRLEKPVWMLQYNNESHNLRSRKNQKDLSIRLEQFFDHYLKGKPMPVWMERGVPATLKGIDWGYQLIEK
ncbi:MAG: prolyl oligopeptidase family serine peptidase [Bacteroidales bacterium]